MANPKIGKTAEVPQLFWHDPWKLEGAAWNPPQRASQAYESPLSSTVSEHGQILPILVDHDLNIVDGHRRAMVCRMLGVKVLCMILPGTMTKEEAWMILNGTQVPVRGNALVHAYLVEPKVVGRETRRELDDASKRLGRDLLHTLAHMKLSTYSYGWAKRVYRWLGDKNLSFADVCIWFHKYNQTNEVRPLVSPPKGFEFSEPPDKEPVRQAIIEDRPLEKAFTFEAKVRR